VGGRDLLDFANVAQTVKVDLTSTTTVAQHANRIVKALGANLEGWRNLTKVALTIDRVQPQNDGNTCGPNSAARFLRAYGFNVSYQQLKQYASFYGTTPETMLEILKKWRPESNLEEGTSFQRILDLL